jgi:transcriptional regulator with XRE-family HTH domain
MRILRNLWGWTQQGLALTCGIPASYLSLIESGRLEPSDQQLAKIRAALHWTAAVDTVLDHLYDLINQATPEEQPV